MTLQHRPRRGFSLLELLIAMSITIIIVFAVVQMFEMIGDNVVDGRAVLEMNGQLRTTVVAIENDLQGSTVPVRPWPELDSAQGYFEYIEGLGHDLAPIVEIVGNEWGWRQPEVPGTNPPVFDTTLGDLDDVIMFTAKSNGRPFRGQILGGIRRPNRSSSDPTVFEARNEIDDGRLILDPTMTDANGDRLINTIESHVAEIIWWVKLTHTGTETPLVLDSDDILTLHRRVLLVRPDLDLYLCLDENRDGTEERVPIVFFNNFDISARAGPGGVSNRPRMFANSLSDLARRENRFAHDPRIVLDPVNLAGNFEHPFPAHRFVLDALVQRDSFDDAQNPPIVPQQYTNGNQPQRGQDIVLGSVAAFDVKAFDPQAPLIHDEAIAANSQRALAPGDPGWDPTFADHTSPQARIVGRGAFVDLNYLARFFPRNIYPTFSSPQYPEARMSHFSGVPVFRQGGAGPPQFSESRDLYLGIGPRIAANTAAVGNNNYSYAAAVYDTWSFTYERDGIDQNAYLNNGIDEGVDGLDQDGQFGPDDVAERETSPPYPVPLRGLKVTVRLVEKDSKQVRQTSVSIDFTPE